MGERTRRSEVVFGAGGWGGYRRLWTASALSSLGDGVRLTALPLLVLSYTREPLLLAAVTVAGTLPMLISPLAGVAADRWPRKLVLVWVDVARFLLVGALGVAVWTGVANLAVVGVITLLLGVGEVLFAVTSQSILPQVVHPSRLAAGAGRLFAAQTVFRDTVGQLCGGVLFAAAVALPFLVDAASFAVGVVLMASLRTVVPPEPTDTDHPGWSAMLREGVRHLRDDRLLTVLAVMLGAVVFFGCAATVVTVLYLVDRVGVPLGAYGLFLVVSALGALLGGTQAARLAGRFGTFPTALAGLGVAAGACLLVGLTTDVVAVGVLFLLMGAGSVTHVSLTVAFRQATVPARVLGRVNGVYLLLGTGTAPLGALFGGALAHYFDLRTPFLVGGAAQLLMLLASWRWIVRRGGGGSVAPGA
ncbi:MFS transporter [Actinosynnema sp. NPDC020468]|uniref:MFS transporter n=1 Tax=Actinosynnema sp. NPDC020468 TaxID=3154488 RepID=UPI0033F0B296